MAATDARSKAARGVTRRAFLRRAGILTGAMLVPATLRRTVAAAPSTPDDAPLRLFLSGDVMTGRAIDQVLPHSVEPRLYEPFIRDARDYVRLAEAANGAIPRPIDYRYVWGEALPILAKAAPHARIINLESAITSHAAPWPGKGIHYRMHPGNVGLLQAAEIDCCSLANNHVLDWHYAGLDQTLDTLHRAGVTACGAGRDEGQAFAPAIIDGGAGGRILVFGLATTDSGTPAAWAADAQRPGVAVLPDLSARTLDRVSDVIARARRPGDLVIVSIHWGDNWGYAVPQEQADFAHALIERGLVGLVHGHSAHHPKGIEVYRGHLVLYGCGDLINDYEGIAGHEAFRGDLSLLYLAHLRRADGQLLGLTLVPMQMRRFRLHSAPPEARQWLAQMLNREGRAWDTRVEGGPGGSLRLRWEPAEPPTTPHPRWPGYASVG